MLFITSSKQKFSVLLSFAVNAADFFSMQQILFVLLSFQSSRFFKAAGRILEAASNRQNLQGGFNAFLTKGLAKWKYFPASCNYPKTSLES